MQDELIKTETDAEGRTRYTVAGLIVTQDPQEALDLTDTGVFQIRNPMTRFMVEHDTAGSAAYAPLFKAKYDRLGHGWLEKFPWE